MKDGYIFGEICAKLCKQNILSVVSIVAMYEVPVTQKSLSNKQVTVGHMTNVFYQIHYKIFCPNVTFIIAWFPNEMSGFHSTKRCFLEKKKNHSK